MMKLPYKIIKWQGPWVSLGIHVDFMNRYIDLHIIWWIVTIGRDWLEMEPVDEFPEDIYDKEFFDSYDQELIRQAEIMSRPHNLESDASRSDMNPGREEV